MDDINILELLRSKKNATLTVVTTHKPLNSYECTYSVDNAEVGTTVCHDLSYLFSDLDKLLVQDDVTYQITVLPSLALVIQIRNEKFTISSSMLYGTDIFDDNKCTVVVNSPSKVLMNIIRREAVPVKTTIQYQNLTMSDYGAGDKYVYRPNPTISYPVLRTPGPTEPVPFSDANARGYTNVVVGGDTTQDLSQHRGRLIAEAIKHVNNVASGNVHEADNKLPDTKAENDAVDSEKIEQYRHKAFQEGLAALAEEAKRKAAQQSTEDDFEV